MRLVPSQMGPDVYEPLFSEIGQERREAKRQDINAVVGLTVRVAPEVVRLIRRKH